MTAVERTRAWREKNGDRHRDYHRAYMRRYAKQHPDRIAAAIRKWRLSNPEKMEQIQKAFGNEYKAARKRGRRETLAGRARPETCELCGERDERNQIVFDHDHATGDFRGWLCHRCNRVLGSVKDNPALLRTLADYLEAHAVKAA